ncbi:DUF2279 domain-containing protein [Fulvivirga sp. M361]|uniref:DUF2279 domain-containing protein n=1 Tax=Fulvivirga sp. M361 TaxID=2594266 RepID=UPI00162555C7|nr:DUF2279 domain-containing protein [Fulvivirga sp. M361]
MNDSLQQKRLKPLLITSGAVYATSMVGLGSLWYSDFERQSFRFFNDNKEWKQIDKAGHFYSAFHISKSSFKLLKWSGLPERKAIFWGTISSFLALTPIEVFDGFSSGFGASIGDIAANTLGGALFFAQYRIWNETRIHPKYYFRRSNYAALRPELLGSNLGEELLKDYNAQEYWLSFDLSRFNAKIPKWINLSFGYGASGMVFANDQQNKQNGFNPRRHYFIGIDIDLNEYHSKSKIINTILYFINMVRIPGPTLELSDKELKAHFIY